jgi:hypothetical protein
MPMRFCVISFLSGRLFPTSEICHFVRALNGCAERRGLAGNLGN